MLLSLWKLSLVIINLHVIVKKLHPRMLLGRFTQRRDLGSNLDLMHVVRSWKQVAIALGPKFWGLRGTKAFGS